VRLRSAGFTLVELLVVLIVAGILLTIAVTNYSAMRSRAWEASTKANMHTFQLAAEDYGVRWQLYAPDAAHVATLLPQNGTAFANPVFRTTGDGEAWVTQTAWTWPLATGSTRSGIVAYGESLGIRYQIAGRGATSDLPVVYTSGR
jgi:prepilin-type N-terminal cleavage/methylation domain-containing protein